ncbi:hypothetical protein PG995_005730 [Apiospora arundinis]
MGARRAALKSLGLVLGLGVSLAWTVAWISSIIEDHNSVTCMNSVTVIGSSTAVACAVGWFAVS